MMLDMIMRSLLSGSDWGKGEEGEGEEGGRHLPGLEGLQWKRLSACDDTARHSYVSCFVVAPGVIVPADVEGREVLVCGVVLMGARVCTGDAAPVALWRVDEPNEVSQLLGERDATRCGSVRDLVAYTPHDYGW